jgi:predicted RNase H-like HicB family nuclease
MEYAVVIHQAEEGGYWVEVPSLDGCFAQGETVEQAIADARTAIASHLEALRENGQPVPAGSSVLVTTIAVPAA